MKKTVIAFAALATFAGVAAAQSSVTLSGGVSAGYQRTMGDVQGFALTDTYVTLSGVEDLGGGFKLMASTTFDAGDARGSSVNRKDTGITAQGGFGSVYYKNTRSGNLLTDALISGANLPDGIYDIGGSIVGRAPIDLVGYAGAFGPVNFGLALAEVGDKNGTAVSDGSVQPKSRVGVLSTGFNMKPFAVKAVAKFEKTSSKDFDSKTGINYEASAAADFGVAKIALGFDSKKGSKDPEKSTADKTVYFTKDAFSVGVNAPVGPVTVGVDYAQRGTAKMYNVGAQYNLSKRSNLNLSYGKVEALGQQARLSVNHSF